MSRNLVLIGAGSAVFTRGLLADLISADDLGEWEIRLVDIDGVARSKCAGAGREDGRGPRRRGPHHVSRARTDRRDVLPGADFVVTCVGVGGRPAWQTDHEIVSAARRSSSRSATPSCPAASPGCSARSRVMVDIARDVVELAPDAFFFNYSNPMTANVMAMTKYAGAHDVVGLCHGMHHVQRHLAALHRRALRGDLDALRRHQPPDVHLRLPATTASDAWPAVRAKVRAGARGASRPGRPRRHLLGGDHGLEQPVLVGALPPLRRVPRRRGPPRHRVLPAALASRRVLRQDARRRRVLRARDPRVGRGALPGR